MKIWNDPYFAERLMDGSLGLYREPAKRGGVRLRRQDQQDHPQPSRPIKPSRARDPRATSGQGTADHLA